MVSYTRIGLGLATCLVPLVCWPTDTVAEVCSRFPAPLCDQNVRIILHTGTTHVFPGPMLLLLEVQNNSGHGVGFPWGVDVQTPQRWLSFDLVRTATGEVTELRRPRFRDFESTVEGPFGPKKYEPVLIEPGGVRRYLVELLDYGPPEDLAPGEYRLRLQLYYDSVEPMRSVEGPVIRVVPGSAHDVSYLRQLGPFDQEERPSLQLLGALVGRGACLGEEQLSESLVRQMAFYWAWAGAVAERSEIPLLEHMGASREEGMWRDEIAVLAYEVQRERGETARAEATRSAIISRFPGVAWRLDKADAGGGFLAVLVPEKRAGS